VLAPVGRKALLGWTVRGGVKMGRRAAPWSRTRWSGAPQRAAGCGARNRGSAVFTPAGELEVARMTAQMDGVYGIVRVPVPGAIFGHWT